MADGSIGLFTFDDGSLNPKLRAVTESDDVLQTDHTIVLTGSNVMTLTLPPASENNQLLWFANYSDENATIQAATGEYIGGGSDTYITLNAGSAIGLHADRDNRWYAIAKSTI